MTKFERLMKEIGVPPERQAQSIVNANWFLRQGIMYHNHPQYTEARREAQLVNTVSKH